jgi:type II secretory pathway pseudopilin PulG
LIEIATVCAVLGILVSLAVPSFMQMQARSRVEQLLASAKSCREELPRWLSKAAPNRQTVGSESTLDARDTDATSPDPRQILETYARLYNQRFLEGALPGQTPPLVVEPTGTEPFFCRRDGRIHIIPLADPDLDRISATVVVTDENGFEGPDGDGILAVYSVKTGAP